MDGGRGPGLSRLGVDLVVWEDSDQARDRLLICLREAEIGATRRTRAESGREYRWFSFQVLGRQFNCRPNRVPSPGDATARGNNLSSEKGS